MKYLIFSLLLLAGCTKEPVYNERINGLYLVSACNREGCRTIQANLSFYECHNILDGVHEVHALRKDKPQVALFCLEQKNHSIPQ